MQGKAEVMIAVTHLAFARSQKIGTGISANNRNSIKEIFYCHEHKRKSSQQMAAFSFAVFPKAGSATEERVKFERNFQTTY